MWFNQCTCDNCFKLLETLTSSNCFFLIPIEDSKIIQSDITYNSYMPFENIYAFNFADFNNANPQGNLYIYKHREDSVDLGKKTYFCSNKCAFEFVLKYNFIAFYFDKSLNSERAITPHMNIINKRLGGSDYRGLFTLVNLPEHQDFRDKDLSLYNGNIGFPNLYTNRLILREFFLEDSVSLFNIRKETGFIKFFDGSQNEEQYYKKLSIESCEDEIKELNFQYNRRVAIYWAIQTKFDNSAIGFIKVHKMAKADSMHWYIEFAIRSDYRNNGFMKEALTNILAWCKSNGLNELRGMVEIYNLASIKIFDRFSQNKILTVSKNNNGDTRNIWGYSIIL